MSKLLTNLAAFALCVHGLIHLIGTVVYMSLGSLEGLRYETTLAGRWDVGVSGMAVFGMLWAVAGAAFVVAGIGLGSGATWWVGATTGAAVLSLLLSLLDSPNAYMGAAVDVAVLAAVVISVLLPCRPRGRRGWRRARRAGRRRPRRPPHDNYGCC